MKGTERTEGKNSKAGWRTMARQIVPGMVLPAALYAVASKFVSTIPALVIASSVPALDVVQSLCRRHSPSPAALGFLGMAGLTSTLSLWADSPMFILAKGPTISAVAGLAFFLSSMTNRPLCRILASKLTVGLQPEARERVLAEWATERSLHVFKVLSLGWGLLLLATAVQQTVMALTLPAGMALSLESPVHLCVIGLGIMGSLVYVRHAHPVLATLGR